jgi:predicted DsbA family dithiol-disulfide isomerase
MKVEIWSDIACPWCYIGRRRFEKALQQFEHRDQVEVLWRSFQLDPEAPKQYPESEEELLMQRYRISKEKVVAMHARVTALATQEGLDYHFDLVHPVNSFDAHRLIHLAGQHGLQGEMKERLQKAYFTEGRVVSDGETLVQLAVEVGLDADETRRMLETQADAAEVRADERRARVLGIDGVPFFLFDEKIAVSGAQPSEVFMTALQRAWTEIQPTVAVDGSD